MHSTVLWVYVCVCGFVYLACPSRAHVKSPPDLMFVRSRDDNFLPLCLFLSLALKPSLDKRNIFLVDDSCNVSSLLYYSPLQLLITNVVVSFCFLLIDFASTLTDKLVKLKVFCSFFLSSYSRSRSRFSHRLFSLIFWEILTHYCLLAPVSISALQNETN